MPDFVRSFPMDMENNRQSILRERQSHEFEKFVEVCKNSPMWQKEISKFKLPEGFDIVIEPWPYGGLDLDDENRRYFQGLVFAQDTRSGNLDSNFYAYPIPLIPGMIFAMPVSNMTTLNIPQ